MERSLTLEDIRENGAVIKRKAAASVLEQINVAYKFVVPA